jgi:hypothetical protein
MIFRITHPVIGLTIRESLEKALSECKFSGDTAAAANYLIQNIANPNLGIFVSREETAIKAIIVCVLPTTPLAYCPEITLLANWSGSNQICTELVETAISFAKQAGYHNMRVCNQTGYSDRIFERRYRKAGRSLKPLGTMMEFTEY